MLKKITKIKCVLVYKKNPGINFILMYFQKQFSRLALKFNKKKVVLKHSKKKRNKNLQKAQKYEFQRLLYRYKKIIFKRKIVLSAH